MRAPRRRPDLAQVDLGHGTPARRHHGLEASLGHGIVRDADAEQPGDHVDGAIVLGRTQPPRHQDQAGPPDGGGQRGPDVVVVVATARHPAHRDPEGPQPGRQPRGVGVDDLTPGELVADGHDLGQHRRMLTKTPPSATPAPSISAPDGDSGRIS
jgi:hypothetical protein